MRFRNASVLVCSLLLAFPALAAADLVGQWTFEPGIELEDLSGNWAPVTLNGATIEDGQLNVDMAPITWAMADGYTGPDIVSKTLVSWISMDDLTNPSPAGSAITIDRISSDQFDGIIFGEQQPGRWMNGSSFFRRTQQFSPGFEETATDELIQLAYTYEDLGNNNVRITGYRNGEQIGQYTSGSLASWVADDAEVFFGIRHGGPGGGPGSLDAHIEEARVYNEALTQAEIQALRFVSGTGTLTWDGTLAGDWASAHWVGENPPPPPDFPVDDEFDNIRAFIDTPGATVTVAEDGAAMSLDLLAGQVTIGAGNTLAVTYGVKAAGATMVLEDNAQLVAGSGGAVGTMRVGGTATVDVGGTMDVGMLTNTGPAAAFVKKGAGALLLENANGTDVDFGGSLIQVDGGTLATNMAGIGNSPVVLGGGALSLSAASPSVIPPMPMDNLVLHLDPGQLTVGDGNPVTTWADASAAGNDVAQATVDQQPTLVDGVVNDLPVVRFDGNDFLASDAVLAENDDDYTFVAVWNPTKNAVMTVLEQAGAGNGRRAAMLAVNANYGFNGQGNDRHDLVPYNANEWATSIMTIDNSLADNVEIFHNGQQFVGATANPDALDVGVDAFYVGAKVANNAELLDGDLAELLVYDAPLTSSDARALGLNLASKYGFDMAPWSSAGVDATSLDWTVTGDSSLFINSVEPAVVSNPLMMHGVLTVDGLAGAEVTFDGGITIDPAATMVGFDPRVPTDFGQINAGGAGVQIVKGGPSTWTLDSDPVVDGANSTWGVRGGTLKLEGASLLSDRDVVIEGGTLETNLEGLGSSPVVLAGGTLHLSGATATEIPPLPADNLVLHLDPGQLGLGDGSPVATWNDVSGMGNDVSQVAADAQPMLVEGVVNGLPVVRFDGGDFLTLDGGVLAENDDDYTYVAVWNPTRNAVMAVMEQAGPGAHRRSSMLAVNAAYGFNGQNNDLHWLVPYNANEWATSIMTIDNSLENNVQILHNGQEYAGRSGDPGALDVGTQAFYVGAKVTNDGEKLFGDLAELLVYDSALSPAEAQQVGLHLSIKYGFDVGQWTGAPVDATGVDWSVTGDSSLYIDGGSGSIISAPRLLDGVLTIDGAAGMDLAIAGATIDVGSTLVGFDAQAPVTIGPITHEDGAGKQPATIVTRGTAPITLAGANSGLEDDLFNVQGGELRMVGRDAWGGSTQALLSGGLLVIDGVGVADVDMTGHRITVDGAASLEAANLTSLSLGQLTMADGGILTTTGSPISINGGGTADTVIDAGATLVGFDTQSDTDLGVIDGSGAGATIQKLGAGVLVLDEPNVNLAGSTFDVQAGALNAVATANGQTNPLDGASVLLGGGELVLSGRATGDSPTFDNAVDVTADSTLTAGTGAGALGPVAVTLGSAGKGVTVAGGAGLALQTTDGYTLSIPGGVGGAGTVSVPAGDVTMGGANVSQLLISGGQLSLPAGGTAGEVVVSDGALTLGGDLNVVTGRVTGGSIDLDGHGIVVSDALKIVDTNYAISEGSTFTLTGSDMAVVPTLTVSGGTLTVSVPTLPTDNLTLHLAANAVSGVQDGDLVAQWNDLSGRENHLFQDDDASQPTYHENVINGLPVLRFEGDAFLSRDGTVLEEGDDDYTYVAVWYPTTTDGVKAVMEQAGGGAHRRASLLAVNAAYGFNGQNNDRHNLVPYNPEEWITTLMTIDNAQANNVHIWHNGEVFEGASGNPGALDVGVDGFMVGAKVTNSAEKMRGDIAELLVYDSVLSTEDYDALLDYLTEKYQGAGVVPGVIDQSTTNVNVLADSTLALNSVGDAVLGDLAVAAGVVLDIDGAAVDVRNVTVGDGSMVTGDLLVRGTLNPGAAGIAAFTIEGTLEMDEDGAFVVEFGADPSSHDFVEVIGDAYLAGSLQLKALAATPPDGQLYGDSSRSMTVMQTDEEGVVELDDFILPSVGTHLGHGVFLTGLSVEMSEWDTTLSVSADLLQTAPGDTDADREVDNADLQMILGANSFNNGTGFGWEQGDFNGDTVVNNTDLQLILGTGLFGTGSYAAVAEGGLSVVPEPGTLLMLAGGLVGLLLCAWRRRGD